MNRRILNRQEEVMDGPRSWKGQAGYSSKERDHGEEVLRLAFNKFLESGDGFDLFEWLSAERKYHLKVPSAWVRGNRVDERAGNTPGVRGQGRKG